MPYTDPDQQREYQRQWRAARRKQWIAENGSCCCKCGSTDRLEIDHIDPSEKSYNPTYAWSRVDRNEELDKCQILCHDCHALKTSLGRPAEHGSQLAYNRDRCRCERCKDWNQQRVRRQRDARYARIARSAYQPPL